MQVTIKNRLIFAASAFCLAFTSASPAFAKWYECNIRTIGEQNGWIPEVILLDIAPDGSAVKVTDGMIQHYQGKDAILNAKVVKNTDQRLAFRWQVDAKSSTNQTVRMTYSATLMRETNKISIFGNDVAYRGEDTGRGDCKPL